MKRIGYLVIIAAMTGALIFLEAGSNITWWIPRGEGWKPVEMQGGGAHSAKFENETIEVVVNPFMTDLGPFSGGISIKNKTTHDVTFYLAKCYFKDSAGLAKEPITRAEASHAAGKRFQWLDPSIGYRRKAGRDNE